MGDVLTVRERRPTSGFTGATSKLLRAIADHAQQRPDASAITEIGGAENGLTYAELAERSAQWAGVLRGRCTPGAVVIAAMPSGPELAALVIAAIAANIRLLLMHTQIAGPEAIKIARRSQAVAAIVNQEVPAASVFSGMRIEPPRESRGGVDLALLDRGGGGGVVLGSSGTTGSPKLALRESPSLDADALGIIAGIGLSSADRVVFATPLSHSYGVDVLVGTIMAGASLRVMERFDAETLAHELVSGATVLPGVPFIFEAMARARRPGPTGLRLALSAGAPLPDRVRLGFLETWGIEIGQLFGATELGTVSMDVPGTHGFDAGSVGRPLPGVSMRIVSMVDPHAVLPIGREGQLAVRAPSMLSRYLDGDVPMVDGHFLTGDLARIDESGRVRITGRLKLMIDIGAYKVNPLEVEAVLSSHPSVAECVVFAVAASDTLQRLRAMVVQRTDVASASPAELRQYLKERLSPIKVPRQIELVQSLPKSPTGKVLRDRMPEEWRP